MIFLYFLRTILYYICAAVTVFVVGVIGVPTFFISKKKLRFVITICNKSLVLLLRYICGIKVELIGKNNIIQDNSVIYASKHQSSLETFYLVGYIANSCIVYKKELEYIPIFGWYLKFSDMVSIDRSKGSEAIKKILNSTKKFFKEKKSLIIFPEGTRRPVDAKPEYKNGIYLIYKSANVPVIPVAHNSGNCIRYRSFIKYPGKVKFEFLDPIEPGLSKDEFMDRLVNSIEKSVSKMNHKN